MSSQLLQSSQVAEIYAGSSDLRLAEKGNKQFSLESYQAIKYPEDENHYPVRESLWM